MAMPDDDSKVIILPSFYDPKIYNSTTIVRGHNRQSNRASRKPREQADSGPAALQNADVTSPTARSISGGSTKEASANLELKEEAVTEEVLRKMSASTTKTLISNQEPPSSKPSARTLLCFSALVLSIFLVALDNVLLPTALPSISVDFAIPDSLYAWAGSVYLLSNAATIPFWGKLSDIFGRKPIILLSSFIFLVGSLLCAVSSSATMLIVGRAVQGLGGGGVNVLVYVCVADMFSIRDRSFYMGIVGAMYAVASALGPVLGGVFAQRLTWRWCFYINLPLVSITLLILQFTICLHNPRTPFIAGIRSIDWLGIGAIVLATVLTLVGLQLGGLTSYNTAIVLSFLTLGGVFYCVFPVTQWWTEKHAGSPIMPLRIFRDTSNLSALGVCACDALVFNSVAYVLPLYFQLVLSASPSLSGVYMLAIAIPLALVSLMGGWIIEKTGRFLEVLQSGLALMTIGIGLLITLQSERELGKIIAFLIIIGVGFGPNFSAPLIALQTRVQAADMAAGTSAFGFVRMVSGAIGVVSGQVVFQLLMRPHRMVFVDSGIARTIADRLARGHTVSEMSELASLTSGQKLLVKTSMTQALRGTWIFYTVFSGLGLLISFGIKRARLGRASEKGDSH